MRATPTRSLLSMPRRDQRILLGLAALTVLLAVLQSATGISGDVLLVTPALVLLLAPAVHERARRRPQGDRQFAVQHQRAVRTDRRPARLAAPAHQGRRRPASYLAALLNQPKNIKVFDDFIAGLPGSSPRSPARRPTARGSTSTSVTSTARADPARTSAPPYDVASRGAVMSVPFRERNPVPIGAIGLLVIALLLVLAFNVSCR